MVGVIADVKEAKRVEAERVEALRVETLRIETERLAKIEAERVRVARTAQAQVKASAQPTPSRSNSANNGAGQTYTATFYTAWCNTGCTGVTATGLNVSNTIYTPSGLRVVAVDPSVIPLGSIVQVTLANGAVFNASAEDTGGRIKGRIVDVLVASKGEARRLGRQTIKVHIIRRGR